MKPFAFVFPGQGSQKVGMGKDLYDAGGFAKECFDRAGEILGSDIKRICFEGPEEELKQTVHTQPALYLCSVIAAHRLAERGIQPTVVAGHSVGEFAALETAGAYDWETGLRLLARRARHMDEASRQRPGSMAAVMGLDEGKIEEVCRGVTTPEEPVGVGLYNTQGQTVISGSREGVTRAIEQLKAAGARRAMELNVSGAFHSPLLTEARDKFAQDLAKFDFGHLSGFYISNFSGQTVEHPDNIKDHLAELLVSPVRWTACMAEMFQMGVRSFVEVGPGNVLQGLLKKMDPEVRTMPAGTLEEIDAVELPTGD